MIDTLSTATVPRLMGAVNARGGGARDQLIIEGRKDMFIHEVTAGPLIPEQDDSLFRNILK